MAAQANAPVIIRRKKVVGGGGGHHGGAWKVAYADFVTAMMAFFMMMWLLNATTEKQRKGLADYFSPSIPIHRISSGSDDPFGGESVYALDELSHDGKGGSRESATDGRQAHGDTGVALVNDRDQGLEELRAIEEELKGRAGESLVSKEAARHIITRVTDEGLIIELFALDGAPLFAPGTDDPEPILRELTGVVSEVSERVTNGIAIGGHVPAVPVVLAANPVWDLSSGRAARVRVLMEQAGTVPARIRRVTGFADRRPALDANPMALRNERIEITLLRRQD